MTFGRGALVASLVALLVAGCGLIPEPPAPSRSVIVVGPDGLRTFTVVRATDDGAVLCTLEAALNPVEGILRGDQASVSEPVWLESAVGRRLSVVWPEGFTIRFEPEAVLRDERGVAVARAGTIVTLGQVGETEAAGTLEDPYIASGLVFEGCYPYIP